MVRHPRLPLVAGVDAERPAVHLWDCEELRDLGTVGGDSEVYGDASVLERARRKPVVTWHPEEPLLVVSGSGPVVGWTPEGQSELGDLLPGQGGDLLAFSPDGRALWASPSSDGADDAWERSDAVDLASRTIGAGPRWDTGIAAHPGGGLVATLNSDQGGTLVAFARVDQECVPTTMRVLRRALILDADCYETPIFSPDGRYLAIRGNAYGNSLAVFEFPSLERVLETTLGEPAPGDHYSPEWIAQMRSWSRHNIAFGARPGTLWIGTPTGTLVEVDLHARSAVEHDVIGSRVTALTTTATGELVVATAEGDLVLVSVAADATEVVLPEADSLRASVTAFLDSTEDAPADSDLETYAYLTDGQRNWEPEDLAAVTTATSADPSWLQLQAAHNNARDQDE
ncbi:hypothetical protein K7711_00660 [Nocardia sp. CA2R105]|nr:hypothetical protein [Nocardia coffeae]